MYSVGPRSDVEEKVREREKLVVLSWCVDDESITPNSIVLRTVWHDQGMGWKVPRDSGIRFQPIKANQLSFIISTMMASDLSTEENPIPVNMTELEEGSFAMMPAIELMYTNPRNNHSSNNKNNDDDAAKKHGFRSRSQ